MNRRLKVAVAATATLGIAAGGVATAGAAQKKNEIRVVGGTVFKAGRYVKDNVRFTPANLSVKSGATVTLVNKGTDPAPHTISFVEKRFLPRSFEAAALGPLMEAHQVDPNNEEAPPAVLKVDNGAPAADQSAPLEVDSLGTDKKAGDSEFFGPETKKLTFKVTARKGSKLFYFCAVHPWMQGKITVK
jgi:plastocyanin